MALSSRSTPFAHSNARRWRSDHELEAKVEDTAVLNTVGPRSQVFIVRVWYEAQEEGKVRCASRPGTS